MANHWKTAAIASDPTLLGMYVHLGWMAVERYADRTHDSFILTGSDICAVAGVRNAGGAMNRLQRLLRVALEPVQLERGETYSTPSHSEVTRGSPGPHPVVMLESHGPHWRVTLPNFAKKQGFLPRNGGQTGTPTTTTSTTTSTTDMSLVRGNLGRAKAPPKRKLPEEGRRLSSLLLCAMQAANPNVREPTPSAKQGWCFEMDRMLRLDPEDRTPENVEALLEWLFDVDAGEDSQAMWWRPKIQSPAALRRNWDQLVAAMAADHKPNGGPRDGRQRSALERAAANQLAEG